MENEVKALRTVKSLSRKEKLKISNLYLKQNLKPSDICEEFGLEGQSLRSFLWTSGLTQKKKEIDKVENQQIDTTTNKLIEHKTYRQQEYYKNLQDRSETLTEKALDLADNAEGASELSSALGSVRTAVGLFEQASSNLGESLIQEQVTESGNQYNFFFASGEDVSKAIESIKNSVQKDSQKSLESEEVIDIE